MWWRLFGEKHLDTISAMGNLAVMLRYKGQLDGAAKMKKPILRLQSVKQDYTNEKSLRKGETAKTDDIFNINE